MVVEGGPAELLSLLDPSARRLARRQCIEQSEGFAQRLVGSGEERSHQPVGAAPLPAEISQDAFAVAGEDGPLGGQIDIPRTVQ